MPTRNTIKPKPSKTPSICGSVRAKPTFSPELISMMLFGPGVNSITAANNRKAASNSKDMRILSTKTPACKLTCLHRQTGSFGVLAKLLD